MEKTFILKNKILFLFFTIILTPQVFAQTLKSTFPDISTEKGNYLINETVNIEGENFRSFERIRLHVSYFDNSLKQEILLSMWDVYSDGKGRFSSNWQIPEINNEGTNFTLEAEATNSGITTKTQFSTIAPSATSVDITQCANSNASPQNLDCPTGGPSGWVPGIVGSSKARYFEGDSIAYRNVMQDLIVGHNYKWTVRYDTTKGGLNAIDYLTTYNRTILNANPCADGGNPNGFCTAGAPTSTFAIPTDSNVTNGRDQTPATTDDISQIAGNISAWGATITGVSTPVYTGTFPGGDSTASVDITFTANNTTAVLAWGGHISTRSDWGQSFGSVNITGAPYHFSNGGLMNLTASTTCCSGSQDLQLQSSAVTPSAKIIIIKHATPPSNFQFGFTTNNLSPGNFTLTDNSVTTDPMKVFDNITTFNVKTITETNPSPYTLVNIVCTVDIGTGGTPAPVRIGNSINIDIKAGDQVTCTFNNDFVTAAAVRISGRVFNPAGAGLSRAMISMTDANGHVRTVMTNHFGYFSFDNVDAGNSYLFNIQHKSHTFAPQLIAVTDEISDLYFYPGQ